MNAFKEVEQKAQSTLLKGEQGAKAWFGTNWVPVAVGMVFGLAVSFVIHHL